MNNLNEYEFNMEVLGEANEYEQQEGEVVNELMNVSNEQEFEYFLGNIWNAAKQLYNSPQGQAIKKDFISGAKSFGKKMLPSLGRNLGGYFDGGRGAKYGGQIGSAAGNWIFGEVGENEAVDYLRVVRKAAKYLNKALATGSNPSSQVASRRMVSQAINQAAKPVLAKRRYGSGANYTSQNQGRWIRQGKLLILQGVR